MPQLVRYLSAYLDPITFKCENEARSVGKSLRPKAKTCYGIIHGRIYHLVSKNYVRHFLQQFENEQVSQK